MQYDYVELTRDVVNAETLGEGDSKYSQDRDSPMDPLEKEYSATPKHGVDGHA